MSWTAEWLDFAKLTVYAFAVNMHGKGSRMLHKDGIVNSSLINVARIDARGTLGMGWMG